MDAQPSPALTALRSEPYRIFFPLAIALGAAGVAPWLLLGAGATQRYLGSFHAVTQMQAFMPAFAAGFLLTAIPKRTQTAEASWIEIGALALLLPAVSVAALLDRAALAEAAYAAALVVLAQFALRRVAGRRAGRRAPASFALVPVGLAAGVGGAALLAAGSAPLASLGRALVLEGVFLCLVLGVGVFFFGLALHGRAAPDVPATPRGRALVAAHALAGVAVIGALVLEQIGFARLGLALRAALVIAIFAASGALRPPSRPGLNRRLVWIAGLAVPTGLAAAAIFPGQRVAAMHLFYVSGLGLMGLTVAAHVALGHGGLTAAQDGRPAAVAAFGALILAAALIRALAALAPAAYFAWLAVAAALWLTGAAVWAVYLVPKMWALPAADGPRPAPPNPGIPKTLPTETAP